MTTPRFDTLRHALTQLLVGIALVAVPASLSADTITWTGNSTGQMTTATNWAGGVAPTAADDVYIAGPAANAVAILTLAVGFNQNANGNFAIRSITASNHTGNLGSGATGLRITSSSNLNVLHRQLVFGTSGITIVSATNNIVLSANSSTNASNVASTLTLNLNFSGFGTIHTDATSAFRVTEAGSSISGTGGIIKTGDGSIRLGSNQTYTGGTELVGGTALILGSGTTNNGTIVTSAFGTGALKLSGGALVSSSDTGRTINSAVQLNGTVAITSAISGNLGNFTISNVIGSATTLLQNSTLNIATTANWNQAISGGFGLTKTGAGKLVLNAANTHSGTTTVSNGTLELGTTGSLAGALVVASGATLSGSGTISGATTIAGIHSPGFSPGIQNFGSNLTYTTGATVNWELAANTSTQGDPTAVYDQINVGGTLNFAGATTLTPVFNLAGSTVDWNNAFWGSNQTWKIYDAAALSNFSNLTLAGSNYADSNGLLLNNVRALGSFNLSQSSNDVYLNYAIPEPSTYAALFGVAALGFVAWRRRRNATTS